MILASFGFFLLLFVAIGMLSLRKRQETGADYLLASQDVKPWLVALSAVATNNSGYMFKRRNSTEAAKRYSSFSVGSTALAH